MFHLGCESDDVDCIVDMPVKKLQLTFTENWALPPCREGCEVAPVVDGQILPEMITLMQDYDTVRRVPLIYGWN